MKKEKNKIFYKSLGILIFLMMLLTAQTNSATNTASFLEVSYSKAALFTSTNNNFYPTTNEKDILNSRGVILSQSFEQPWTYDSDGDLAPPGWEVHIFNTEGNTLSTWWDQIGTVTYENGDVIPPDGEYQAMVFWDYSDQDEWLISPLINLSEMEGTELSFMFYGEYGSPYGDHYYVKVSPSGNFEKNNFTDTLWDASDLPLGHNHYDTSIQLDLSTYDGKSIRLAWHDYALGGLWYAHHIDNVKVTVSGDADLECNGELSWVDVEPGATVAGEFIIYNQGDSHSDLNWEISSYPEWGTWTITPDHGEGLQPEDGEVTIEVEIIAPKDENQEFTGEVLISNVNNPEDSCCIPVSLITPVNQNSPYLFIQLLQRLSHRFPFLEVIYYIFTYQYNEFKGMVM
jgi:hypothetical protein